MLEDLHCLLCLVYGTDPPSYILTYSPSSLRRCAVDNRVTRVAWLNRSTILYTSNDKWSIDPRVVLIANTKSSYSIEIQNVDIYDEGPYTCSIQTDNHPKTSRVHLIVQGKLVCSSDVAVILVADDGPEV